MSLDALRETLPAYAKDLSLNLSSLAGETAARATSRNGGLFCWPARPMPPAQPTVVRKAVEAAAPRRWPRPGSRTTRPSPPRPSWA